MVFQTIYVTNKSYRLNLIVFNGETFDRIGSQRNNEGWSVNLPYHIYVLIENTNLHQTIPWYRIVSALIFFLNLWLGLLTRYT